MMIHTSNKTTKPALSPPPDNENPSNIPRDRTPIIYPNPFGAGLGIKSSDTPQIKQRNPPSSPPPDNEIYPNISRDRTPIIYPNPFGAGLGIK